jgi:hypothetical protein
MDHTILLFMSRGNKKKKKKKKKTTKGIQTDTHKS